MSNYKKFPSEGGLCLKCHASTCPMPDMLRQHSLNQKVFGADYRNARPDLWEMDAIEEPETDKYYNVKWCPMFTKI